MIYTRHIVSDAFRVMSEIAPDLLQAKLQPYLAPEQRWPDILMALDHERRTVNPQWYKETDPALQLRMVTERLGKLGYPFDDGTRETSARGQMLRLARNTLAHGGSHTPFEALRIFDDIENLLARLGDDQAHGRLSELRQSSGLASNLFEADPVTTDNSSTSYADELTAREIELASQAALTVRDSASGGTPELVEALGSERQEYQPYRVIRQGDPEDLESRLGPKRAEKVQAVIQNVVDSQWPVMEAEVIDHTIRSFGRQRKTASPHRKIKYQIQKMVEGHQLHVSNDGAVWPSKEDEQNWHGFRPDPHQKRKAEEIPVREICNAAFALMDANADTGTLDLVRLTAAEFGYTRKGKNVNAHFGAALEGVQTR